LASTCKATIQLRSQIYNKRYKFDTSSSACVVRPTYEWFKLQSYCTTNGMLAQGGKVVRGLEQSALWQALVAAIWIQQQISTIWPQLMEKPNKTGKIKNLM